MKKIIILLTLLITLSVYSLSKNEYYKMIDNAYKTKNYSSAIPALERAIQEYPDEANFFSNLTFFYVHTKQFEKALDLAKKAFPRFPGHTYVVSAYKAALVSAGWNEFNKKNYQKASGYFATGLKHFPEDGDVLNGYGSALRELKRYEEAIPVLEKGFLLAPNHPYIRQNLVWTYYSSAWELIRNHQKETAWERLQKAYALGQNMEENFHTGYIYALLQLKRYEEAKPAHALALKKFGLTDEVYKSGYWLIFHPIEDLKQQKKYSLVIRELKKLYSFSLQKNLVRENGQSFVHTALIRMSHDLAQITSRICPYWRKFTPAEKVLSNSLYQQFKENLPAELEYLVFRFQGDNLYRENKVKDARRFLEKAYHSLIKHFPSLYRVQTVQIPSPIRGHQLVMNYKSSIHLTHMGLNRHCYDIIGCNKAGRMYRTDGKVIHDWYGYGVPVYAPVSGKVVNSEDGNQDDPINPPVRGDGNWVGILSADNKIYNFYHLKKNSIKVRVGDMVQAGQQIAELGNSSSTIPHLHFGVYSSDWMVSYPVEFTNYTFIRNNRRTAVRAGTPGTNDREDHIYVE